MDLTWSAEERAFREEVRTFVQGNLPADMSQNTQYKGFRKVSSLKTRKTFKPINEAKIFSKTYAER